MTSRHDQDPGVRLQVHELVTAGLRRLTATVRCLQGPTRLHAHFHRINQAIAIDLDLIGIEVYGSPVDQLDPVWTARVTMTGVLPEGHDYTFITQPPLLYWLVMASLSSVIPPGAAAIVGQTFAGGRGDCQQFGVRLEQRG